MAEPNFLEPLQFPHRAIDVSFKIRIIIGRFDSLVSHKAKAAGQSASCSVMDRPCFDSCFATSALRSFSIKLERLLFSCLANTTSLAFKVRSILSEMAVSFISIQILRCKTSYDQE